MSDREINYENQVRDLLKSRVIPKQPDVQMLESKVLADIIICRNDEKPKLFFLGACNELSVNENLP